VFENTHTVSDQTHSLNFFDHFHVELAFPVSEAFIVISPVDDLPVQIGQISERLLGERA
jgi:hypothetical protein